MKRYTGFILSLLAGVILLQFSSCGVYSFSGASIPPEVKTIAISYFPNRAKLINPSLSQNFSDALKDKFVNETNLILVSDNGDMILEGEIRAYDTKPIAIQGNEQAALNRLSITVFVRFINKYDESQNYESSFTRYQDYESSKSLSSVEAELVELINADLVEDIFNRAVVNW